MAAPIMQQRDRECTGMLAGQSSAWRGRVSAKKSLIVPEGPTATGVVRAAERDLALARRAG